jgi:8-amino-7-oxononanoate synthase
MVDGRELIMFGSNDYLGFAADPNVLAAAHAALEKHGAGTGMNPLLGTTSTHRELIRALRDFTNCEDVLLFNSCTAANCAVIATLVGPDDVVLSDELNHASIVDGCRLARGRTIIYRHNDIESLRRGLAEAKTSRLRLVVTDGVFSMEGECAPLREILEVVKQARGVLVVDESHSAGVIGPSGRGTGEFYGIGRGEFIQTGTLAKAFGAGIGGYVAGPRDAVAHLRDRARFFIFTSGVPAVCAGAAIAALKLLDTEPARLERLRANVVMLRSGLQSLGFELLGGDGPIVPVLLGTTERARRLSLSLLQMGIYVPAFSFPIVPEGSARLRLQVSAAHTREDLQEALSAFETARRT